MLRRFSSKEYGPAITVADLNSRELASRYLEEGYSEFYISLGGVPDSESDWDFLDRYAEEVLVFEGGRQHGRDLEITKFRVFSKKSQARKNFNAIKRAVTGCCDGKGLVTLLSATRYDDIWFSSRALLEFQLWLAWKMDSNDFVCVSPTSDDTD